MREPLWFILSQFRDQTEAPKLKIKLLSTPTTVSRRVISKEDPSTNIWLTVWKFLSLSQKKQVRNKVPFQRTRVFWEKYKLRKSQFYSKIINWFCSFTFLYLVKIPLDTFKSNSAGFYPEDKIICCLYPASLDHNASMYISQNQSFCKQVKCSKIRSS